MMSIPIGTTAASLALLFASLVQAHAGPPQGSSSSSSWRPLFDGHSLNGWEHSRPGKFVVEDVDEENETGEFDHASQIVERKVLLY